MNYEMRLKIAFTVAFVVWLAANLYITPRYIRTMRRVRDPRRAPFLMSALWVGLSTLLNCAYWMWLLFWTPTDPTIRHWVVFIIPLDLISGAVAWALFNSYVIRNRDT